MRQRFPVPGETDIKSTKRKEKNIEYGLFSDQYDTEKKIFESATTKVYLVRHKALSEQRILKRIEKHPEISSAARQKREAFVLQGLRHSGIPILYDYGEDDSYIYIVEEYIRGMPLTEYFLYHKFISQKQVIRFVIQLCEILEYLHTRKPEPILYQDLKPEHVIVRGDDLILIDYGIARHLAESNDLPEIMGTPGYMAPELSRKAPDERSDLYGLGQIAKELAGAMEEKVPARMNALIKLAIQENPQMRPASVAEWRAAWERLKEREEKRNRKKGERSLENFKIAVVGNDHGIGTTHIALAFAAWLGSKRKGVYYRNLTEEPVLERISRARKEFDEKEGIIYHGGFAGIRDYGPAVVEKDCPDGIFVLDCGTSWENAREVDVWLYIMSSSPWKDHSIWLEMLSEHVYIIQTPAAKGAGITAAIELKRYIYAFPLDKDPFSMTREKKKLFQKIWEREMESVSG